MRTQLPLSLAFYIPLGSGNVRNSVFWPCTKTPCAGHGSQALKRVTMPSPYGQAWEHSALPSPHGLGSLPSAQHTLTLSSLGDWKMPFYLANKARFNSTEVSVLLSSLFLTSGLPKYHQFDFKMPIIYEDLSQAFHRLPLHPSPMTDLESIH
jgi:hypothetical protein